MDYSKPFLLLFSDRELTLGICVNGEEASRPSSCLDGPAASFGGCEQGMAASSKCLSGSSALNACRKGSAFSD